MIPTKRIPRPIGSTELAILYNRTNDEEAYQGLQQKIIHHYINNNFSYCGIYMNLEQFSAFIKRDHKDIMVQIGQFGKELGRINDAMFDKDYFRALGNFSIKMFLEDRSAIMQQVAILQSSQGASYKPFISGELIKALKLTLDSESNLLSLMKAFQGTGSLSPYAPEDPNPNEENSFTAADAIALIKDRKITPLLQSPDKIKALAQEYDIENMPDVNALTQTNIDTSKEALDYHNITKLDESLLMAEVIKEDKTTKHQNRRKRQLGIKDQDNIE